MISIPATTVRAPRRRRRFTRTEGAGIPAAIPVYTTRMSGRYRLNDKKTANSASACLGARQLPLEGNYQLELVLVDGGGGLIVVVDVALDGGGRHGGWGGKDDNLPPPELEGSYMARRVQRRDCALAPRDHSRNASQIRSTGNFRADIERYQGSRTRLQYSTGAGTMPRGYVQCLQASQS
ncbi:hypothetical protein BV25DRAFT_438686 [Artomyces pyxidatus]|uniref:Uncharacterized protein n=1 Tax=Artomyces pyxidatus TaxID=48021 RepID=A0ACB8T2V7_9AGAM|nr:hypothetical protein BV25DRAFT_438686 [Artomyces pyxidatus]